MDGQLVMTASRNGVRTGGLLQGMRMEKLGKQAGMIHLKKHGNCVQHPLKKDISALHGGGNSPSLIKSAT